MSMTNYSLAFGIGTKNANDQWLEVYYPNPTLNFNGELLAQMAEILDYQGGNTVIELDSNTLHALEEIFADANVSELMILMRVLEASTQPRCLTILQSDEAITSVPEAYLKLHLLSHRLVKPHGLDLTGIFGVLPNVAWTSEGAIDLDELPGRQLQARVAGRPLSVNCVDKFPKMTDYVVPNGVRIAHTARVRLGAYVGEGTTVMHEGFINFNAGTLGVSMVEGRISSGVVIGEGSDLGGGCSTMGTLSGGNKVVISVGKNCLIGANAGLGIPLGDRCTIEAGLYLTGASKVNVLDDKQQVVEVAKASALAGKSDLLFRRNSLTGALECLTNKSAIVLNEMLHAHN